MPPNTHLAERLVEYFAAVSSLKDKEQKAVIRVFVDTGEVLPAMARLKSARLIERLVSTKAVADTLSGEFRKLFVFDAGLVSLMLIGMIIGCAIVALLFTAYQLAIAAKVPQFRVRATRRPPTLDLHQGKLWHLFLSHI